MTPLDCLPAQAWAQVTGVFTDIDDTLTTDGAITPDALQALHDLRDAGLTVIAITGRPVGWSEPFALSWPLHAIVAENGAVALYLPDQAGFGMPVDNFKEIGVSCSTGEREQLSKLYQADAPTRAANFQRLQAVAARVLREVPGATLARDSAGRETDIAIDHSEFTHLPQAAIDQAVALMHAAGMNATVSSIHINGWFGAHNKLEGARWIIRQLLGRELDAELDRWVYVGDSTNDQLMFQHFPHSVGVANIARFVPQLSHLPRYVTRAERGAGFAELVAHLRLLQK